ncbi:2-phospho-L-lactate guanylyltransferase [Jatrophihabitans sp. YIM 134969]
MDEAPARQWVVLLPVKAVASSKSRLQPAFDDPDRLAAVVTAMRRDTLAAIRGTAGVVAVVAAVDRPDSARGLGAGVDVVVQQEPGLNGALRAADAYATAQFPAAGRIAVVGDLPALTPFALREVLDAAGRSARAFVPDLAGSGTTMLAVTEGPLEPEFGPGSAARHARTATPVRAAAAARHDVDVPEDLTGPPATGFGPATRAALAEPAAAASGGV